LLSDGLSISSNSFLPIEKPPVATPRSHWLVSLVNYKQVLKRSCTGDMTCRQTEGVLAYEIKSIVADAPRRPWLYFVQNNL
jgi:hypothetical protein